MSRVKARNDIVFYILLVLFIVCFILSESQFNDLGVFKDVLKTAKFVVIALVTVFSLLRNRSVKPNIYFMTLVLLFVLSFNLVFNDGGLSLIPIIMLSWASRRYSVEKIFRYVFMTALLTYLFVILCALAGILNDDVSLLVRGDEAKSFAGTYNRHNMGFLLHNQVAICFFVLYLMYILLRRDNIKWYETLAVLALDYVVLFFFGSRIIFVLIPVTCIGYYAVRIIERSRKRHTVPGIAVSVFPACCFLSFFTAVNYKGNSKLYRMLDMLFSNRLRLAHEALTHYGVHLTGSGQNAATYNSMTLLDNTVDNGYISFIIQNGLIAGTIIIGVWTYITCLSVRNNNKYLTLALVMIAIENMINPHLGSYLLIPFFCMLVNTNDPFVTNRMIVLGTGIKQAKKHRRFRLSTFKHVRI